MSLLSEGGGNAGAGDSGAAGGGGSGGSAGSSGANGAGAGSGAGNSGAGGTGSGAAASWRDSLPEEIRGNATLSKFSDVNNLAKSYIEMQSLVGKKGVFPPDEKATPEQLRDFYKSIGQPDLEKFEIKAPEGKKFNEKIIGDFKKIAHESGLLPRQAQPLIDWWIQHEAGTQKANSESAAAKTKEEHAALAKEWGDGFDKQIALARLARKDVVGEELGKILDNPKYADDVHVVKLLAKVGALLGEDKLRGDGGGKFGQTPQEIDNEISKVMGDKKHPYFDKSHPAHAAALQQMESLYKKRYGA